MKFAEFQSDEITAWLGDPVTRAFVDWLKERQALARDEAMVFTRNGETQPATVRVGRMDGYLDAITTIQARAK